METRPSGQGGGRIAGGQPGPQTPHCRGNLGEVRLTIHCQDAKAPIATNTTTIPARDRCANDFMAMAPPPECLLHCPSEGGVSLPPAEAVSGEWTASLWVFTRKTPGATCETTCATKFSPEINPKMGENGWEK